VTLSERIRAMFAPATQPGPLMPLGVRDAKAVTSIEPWSRGPMLEMVSEEPQKKAARYLQAYKVGWFNKAGRKITGDLAALPWNVSDGDAESGDREAVLDRPDLDIPFATLSRGASPADRDLRHQPGSHVARL
jgi:hypothetical protein